VIYTAHVAVKLQLVRFLLSYTTIKTYNQWRYVCTIDTTQKIDNKSEKTRSTKVV